MNEDIILIDKFPKLGIRFVAIIFRPCEPQERPLGNRVDEEIGWVRLHIGHKARLKILLQRARFDRKYRGGVTGCWRNAGEHIHARRPSPYRQTLDPPLLLYAGYHRSYFVGAGVR